MKPAQQIVKRLLEEEEPEAELDMKEFSPEPDEDPVSVRSGHNFDWWVWRENSLLTHYASGYTWHGSMLKFANPGNVSAGQMFLKVMVEMAQREGCRMLTFHEEDFRDNPELTSVIKSLIQYGLLTERGSLGVESFYEVAQIE